MKPPVAELISTFFSSQRLLLLSFRKLLWQLQEALGRDFLKQPSIRAGQSQTPVSVFAWRRRKL